MDAPSSTHAVPAAGTKRAIVVGASSGMGAALTRQLASRGTAVVAVARRADHLEALAAEAEGKVVPLVHDVLAIDDVTRAFDEAVERLGGLDEIWFAAGTMPDVGPDEFDTEKDLAMIDVNFAGAVAWLNLAARLFHTQRAGLIVGFGSIAGDRGRKGAPVYGATKAALATYLESLRNRLASRGVRVVTVKPGMVETPMTAHLDKLVMPVSAERAAGEILRAGRGRFWNEKHIPLRWWAVSRVIRSIPSLLFRRTSI